MGTRLLEVEQNGTGMHYRHLHPIRFINMYSLYLRKLFIKFINHKYFANVFALFKKFAMTAIFLHHFEIRIATSPRSGK